MITSRHLEHAYVPPLGGNPLRKLIVVLHGRGDSPDGFAWMPQDLGLPEPGYLMLQAPDPYYGGWSWYDLPPDQGPGVLRSRALITATLDDLQEDGLRSEDIVLFGFSQGCLMAVDVGLRYGRPLAGICGVSGYVMWPERAGTDATPHARAIPWLITAGRQDPTIPYATTEDHVNQLKAAGIPVDWRGYHKGHTIDPGPELSDIRAWLAERISPAAR